MVEDFYLFDLGGVDIIFGITWLAKLGEVVINCGKMTMSYYLAGKRVEVRGDPALSRKLVEPRAVLKIADAETWTLVWEMGRVEHEGDTAWHGDLTAAQVAELSAVLEQHSGVFRELKGLPPQGIRSTALL